MVLNDYGVVVLLAFEWAMPIAHQPLVIQEVRYAQVLAEAHEVDWVQRLLDPAPLYLLRSKGISKLDSRTFQAALSELAG